MPTSIDIKGPHNWQKSNLMTQSDSKGAYDQMVCTKCGCKGKRRGLHTVEVDDRFSDEKIHNCTGERPAKVEITSESASQAGPQFANLKVGTTHKTVDPPEEEEEKGLSGVWVQGTDEPVRLLPREYKPITEED